MAGQDYTFRVTGYNYGTPYSATAGTHVRFYGAYLPLVMKQIPPSGTIKINKDAEFTAQHLVTLTLTLNVTGGGPVTAMRIWNKGDPVPDYWINYTPTMARWELKAGTVARRSMPSSRIGMTLSLPKCRVVFYSSRTVILRTVSTRGWWARTHCP